MKMKWYVNLVVLVSALIGLSAFAQEQVSDKFSLEFSDPSKPGFLKVGLTYGSVTVRGYDGTEVIIESVYRNKENRESRQRKSKGMYVIPNTSMGLTIEEEDNKMKISGHGNSRSNLIIDVPVSTSLRISTVNGGDIVVENIEGEIEANNTNGGVKIIDVSGAVIANTTNGNVIVTFVNVKPNKAMSFISFNGKVDITFPPNIKADLILKTQNGNIYSDFEIEVKRTVRKIEESPRRKGGKYKVKLEGDMVGKLNGGGPEMHLSTYNGNIYIRKN